METITAAGDKTTILIHNLATSINKDGKVPVNWEESFIACLYKGKGDALDRDNYNGLKLTEQVMKVLECIVDSVIRSMVDLEKAFDRKPRKVIWWAMRKLDVEEWVIWLVQGMYTNAEAGFTSVMASVRSLGCTLVFTKVQC